jgi:Cu2+-exporting ATPase
MTTTCTLCDLPLPGDPYSDTEVDGAFCCRGCLTVAQTLEDPETIDGESVRERSESAGESVPDDAEEAFLGIDGMHCGTCEAFVESRATALDGVYDADASYAAELARIQYDSDAVSTASLGDAVSALGYSATELDDGLGETEGRQEPPWRLLVGGFCGMMVMSWYLIFLYPAYFNFTPTQAAWAGAGASGPLGLSSLANLWLLTSVVLFFTGWPILRGAYVSLRAGKPNMDLLVALAAVNAYVYSTILALRGGEVYFDITVVVVLVVTLGGYYEDRIKRRAASGLSSLTEKRVSEAQRRLQAAAGGKTETVPVAELATGDEVVVKPGGRVPVDGTVTEGTAAVDESLVTGESRPVRKSAGDPVIGGSVVTDSALVITVTDGAESTVDRLVRVLWEIQSTRGSVQRMADRIAGVFVPLVLALAVVAMAWQTASGEGVTVALLTGLTVLVVSCPCALGLATPLAIAAGVRDGLADGIVVTDESVFETAPDVDVVAFDKTGTLTTGEMHLVDPGTEGARRRAAAVEQFASHPVGDAITDHTTPPDWEVTEFERHPGRGVSARVEGEQVVVGHPALFASFDWRVPQRLESTVRGARERGLVPVLVGWDGRVEECLVAGDQPRLGWQAVVDDLGENRRIVVITGDDERAAKRFRDHDAVDDVFADVPPEAKAQVVDSVEGTVAMVGDGTNDAPALAAADLGIALEGGGALATDAADAVVTTNELTTVPTVFEVTTGTRRRIRQNLGWAFCYNAVAVPVAVAGLLNPLVAAVAMAASSLLVVGNSSRSIVTGTSSQDRQETETVSEQHDTQQERSTTETAGRNVDTEVSS